MKYHEHYIVKAHEDLGEECERLNRVYHIFNIDKEYIDTALTLSTAKQFIDSGYNSIYL